MLIKRLYLRNFRVYEDELDLELPPGLVGIYGPNGAGKSTLLEAILFTLWGRSRTTKDLIRSSGVGGECVTEVEFEHEGHLYLVRRKLKGINAQVSVEAHCDGALMSSGTRDAERFVESVLGMDDAAFRASVFTEQKQLAAFSNQAPAERRRLVLQLLGITPLDAARDAARKDAKELASDHDRLRAMLPDLTALETEAQDQAARAEASEAMASEEQTAAGTARQQAESALEIFHAHDLRRQEYDALVVEGRGVRKELDSAEQLVGARRAELADLDEVGACLRELEEAAGGLEGYELVVERLSAAASAARSLDAVVVGIRPPEPDQSASQTARRQADALREAMAAGAALLRAAETEAERARGAAAQSDSLEGDADCPTCGQPLGDSYRKVQAHRAAELNDATHRVKELSTRAKELGEQVRSAAAEAEKAADADAAARAAFDEWQLADRRRTDGESAADAAWAAVLADGESPDAADPAVAGAAEMLRGLGVGATRDRPATGDLESALVSARSEVRRRRESAGQALGIRTRLQARPGVERSLAAAVEQFDSAASRVEVLREKVRALDFRAEALASAAAARDAAVATREATATRAQQAALTAATERERATAAAMRRDEGRARHAKLSDLESEARHRSRAADLLSEFRNTVVASVGPRLAVQAADLFGELTDHEYEQIEVDPETYQLQISDGGRLYGLDRFSGSEIDLANLALRVAISEHIHFQSGGSVGLLVLDEVFGPLDEERKTRMLLALERLRGRFRQVLVVTHDAEIKEQMPNAIEVVKRPGRRATARVLGD
jgi:exonuclease SbcC